MRILFATGRLYPPDRHGGAQNSAHALLTHATRAGHTCEAITAHAPGWRLLFRRGLFIAGGRRVLLPPDSANGYPTRRAPHWQVAEWAARRITSFRPDVLVTDQIELLEQLAPELPGELPIVLRVAELSRLERLETLPAAGSLRVIANSRFIARRLRDRFGIDAPVLYPLVDTARYHVRRRDPDRITFFNPIPEKGVDLAFEVARIAPGRHFLFISGWPRPGNEERRVAERCRELPNIELHPWTRNVAAIYARTRILFFPTQWEEPFGRVALEAQASGIPVLASDRGGLPEAVGNGGRILPFDAPASAWADALAAMLDPTTETRLSDAARANTRRPEFQPQFIADRFLDILHDHTGSTAGRDAAVQRT